MTRSLPFVSAALAAALTAGAFSPLIGAPAFAQENPSGCILDRCQDKLGPSADRPRNERPETARPETGRATPRGADERDQAGNGRSEAGDAPSPARVAPGGFDFYVLALSWSPGFCAARGGGRGSQCAPGAGLGFVVHGLWPQNERGYPADCDGIANPPRYALEAARGLFPDEGLARYEWRKHGTCTGLAPSAYFAEVKRAREMIEVPAAFGEGGGPRRMSPADIQRAFLEANRRMRPGMMAVGCAGGALQEVRICLSKDLRDFRACPDVARQACRAGSIDIPPPM